MATGASPDAAAAGGALGGACAPFVRECEAAGLKAALAKAVAVGAAAAGGDAGASALLSELQGSPVQWYQVRSTRA